MIVPAPETPCVVIALDVVHRNLERMASLCKAHGCALRPHVKTHKIPSLARLQIEYGASGITVAKLAEAEVMADHGLTDIFVAYPLIGEGACTRAVQLARRIRLLAAVDNAEAAAELARAAAAAGLTIEVRLEIDTGMRRTGVPLTEAIEVAHRVATLKGVHLQGIFTFRGLMLDGKTNQNRELCGRQEGEFMVELARNMRAQGLNIEDVSVGSTPTAEFCAQVPGVTEVRPGTYIFNDMMQANTQACTSLDDVAAVVLTRIVSTAKADMYVVDAGCKSLSTDVPLHTFPYHLRSHGHIVGHEELELERLSEEHGMIAVRGQHSRLQAGDLLAVIPNHICPTINLYDHVYLAREGQIVERVAVAARGKNH